MSRFVGTFYGSERECIEALATVREISRGCNEPIDLVLAERCKELIPLVKLQPYVANAYTIPNWNSMAPPKLSSDYQQQFDLTLSSFDKNVPWIDQFGTRFKIKLFEPLPYIEIPDAPQLSSGLVLVTFAYRTPAPNSHAQEIFLSWLRSRWREQVLFADVQALSWVERAKTIQQADIFIGDTLYSPLAHAVNKPVLLFEPMETYRQAAYSNPYGRTFTHENCYQPNVFEALFKQLIDDVRKAKDAEVDG